MVEGGDDGEVKHLAQEEIVQRTLHVAFLRGQRF